MNEQTGTTTEITNPYEKASIYASVLNSVSRVLATSNANRTIDVLDSVVEDITTETIVDNAAAVEIDTTDNASEENTETAIDQVSDDDDDTWTDRMLEKYSKQINFVNETVEAYGEEEITKWLTDVTNGLYDSFASMDPQTYLSTVTLLEQCVA